MNIQLKEIILWPQNKELDIKTINFVEGKVNVISLSCIFIID